MHSNKQLSRKKENFIMTVQYTLLFCLLVVGVYGVLIIGHRTFIQNGDGYKQGFFWTAEVKFQIENILAGKGLSLWSWSRGQGLDLQMNYLVDPFNWIAALFPAGYMELGYTVVSLLKMYCGGLAFLAFMRYTGAGVFESIFGSICYVFTGYFIVLGLIHASALFVIFMFPLLIISVERIYKGKSPALFSIFVAFYIIKTIYYAYMAGLVVVVYILVRYFAYHEFSIKHYLKTIGGFMFWGIIGILLAGFELMADFMALTAASSESATDAVSLLFSKNFYLKVGMLLTGSGDLKTYLVVGLTLIVIMLAASALPEISLKRTDIIMSVICFIAMLLPAACSFLNGMGYPAFRWLFMFDFFAAWTAAAQIGNKSLHKNSRLLFCILALCVTAAWTVGLHVSGHIEMSRRALVFISIQLAGGVLFLLILLAAHRRKEFVHADRILTFAIMAAVLTAGWTSTFFVNRDLFVRNNEINKALINSTQRAGSMIDDDGFYRIDQVDYLLYRHTVISPPNESIWWRTKPLYVYTSKLPKDLLEFNGLVGNNYGYSKRVFIMSNDNRAGLDFLCGVKYFLGDDTKNDRTGSDEYAGYDFEFYKEIDGVRVFKNKHDVSLGYVYDKYLPLSEFMKLDRLEREQAMLQAVVADDETDMDGLERLDAADIETAIEDVPYEIVKEDGVRFEDGKIIAEKEGASFTLSVGDVSNSQVVVSFDGLLRDAENGQSKGFVLHAKNEYVDEMADNTISNQSIPNIKDYDLNMGYYDSYENGRIKIRLSKEGTYEYESLRIRAMDAALFDKYEDRLSANIFDVDSCTDKEVTGSISCSSPGMLFMSISDYNNWDVYIDGEKTDRIDGLNVAFTGAKVPAGEHSVRLVHNNRELRRGAVVSFAGLVLLIAASICRKRLSER